MDSTTSVKTVIYIFEADGKNNETSMYEVKM